MATPLPQDIFICVFYNRDDVALRKLLACFLGELEKEYDCLELTQLNNMLPLVGLRAMFLLLIVMDHRLRYWAMQYETSNVSKPPPEKVCLFLRQLRDDIIPSWMSDERKNSAALVQQAKELYIRC